MLELLVVMAIIAILMASASPIYIDHLVKSRRNLAQINLLKLASQLEKFYSLNATYQGATLAELGSNAYSDDHFYQFNIQSANDSTYLIEAIPLGQQALQDSQCKTLSFNEQGLKMSSGLLSPEQCWQ